MKKRPNRDEVLKMLYPGKTDTSRPEPDNSDILPDYVQFRQVSPRVLLAEKAILHQVVQTSRMPRICTICSEQYESDMAAAVADKTDMWDETYVRAYIALFQSRMHTTDNHYKAEELHNPHCPDFSSHWANVSERYFPDNSDLSLLEADIVDILAEIEFFACTGHNA